MAEYKETHLTQIIQKKRYNEEKNMKSQYRSCLVRLVGMREHSQVKSNNKDNKTLALLPFYTLL